jgi:hypothetical protein
VSRAKVAPTLRRLVLTDGGGLASAYPESGRELRALLAVARAAERVVRPKHEEDIIPARPWNSLSNAVARLRRVGGKGRAGSL